MQDEEYRRFLNEEGDIEDLRRKLLRTGSINREHLSRDADALLEPLWSKIQNKPSVFPPESHKHDDRYYTETEVDSLLNFLQLSDTPSSYSGNASKYVAVKADESALEFVSGGGGTFLSLSDTPGSYSGEAGKYVAVNAAEDALEFVTGSGGVSTFLDLSDTPSGYTGNADKLLRVNSTPDALVFSSVKINSNDQLILPDSADYPPFNVTERSSPPSSPQAGDVYLDDGTNTGSGNPGWRRYTGSAWEDISAASGGGASSFLGLSDTPGSYSGEGGKYVAVKSDESGLEFISGSGGASPWLLEIDENFDGLATGSIAGKGSYTNWSSWVEDNAGSATTEVVDLGGGNKILRLEWNGGAPACYLDFSGGGNFGLRSGFIMKIRMRINATTDGEGQIRIKTGSTTRFYPVYFNDNGNISYYDGAGKDYGSYSADTWHEIYMIFIAGGGDDLTFTGFLDGDYSIGDVYVGSSNYNLDRIRLELDKSPSDGRQFDIDYIKVWRFNLY